MTDNTTLLAAWQRRVSLPLTLASLLFLVAWALPILLPTLDARLQQVCVWVTWLTWALFAVDYLTQVVLAPNRRAFIRSHLLDLIVIALPVLRPLQILRVVTVLYRLDRSASATMRGNITLYGTVTLIIVLVCASLAVLHLESQHADAAIHTFEDALWWALTTVSTVGYGDLYPVTLGGRAVASVLFLLGVALIGIVTGTLASWITERVHPSGSTPPASQADVRALTEEVRELRAQLAQLTARPGTEGPPPHTADR
ncbi:potassium channel family protein [Thermobifida halotolerans]|uniref:Potassium channel family protein n=1 Tax=Thermobifida halotolerans TaxID=483545 RepID=A0AA97LZ61_9ACTN|nr:potassium channel family protein [Thermobifida halotolerans]UOE20977.1 potassium channel family protein [Thermobifida halotolerans]